MGQDQIPGVLKIDSSHMMRDGASPIHAEHDMAVKHFRGLSLLWSTKDARLGTKL